MALIGCGSQGLVVVDSLHPHPTSPHPTLPLPTLPHPASQVLVVVDSLRPHLSLWKTICRSLRDNEVRSPSPPRPHPLALTPSPSAPRPQPLVLSPSTLRLSLSTLSPHPLAFNFPSPSPSVCADEPPTDRVARRRPSLPRRRALNHPTSPNPPQPTPTRPMSQVPVTAEEEGSQQRAYYSRLVERAARRKESHARGGGSVTLLLLQPSVSVLPKEADLKDLYTLADFEEGGFTKTVCSQPAQLMRHPASPGGTPHPSEPMGHPTPVSGLQPCGAARGEGHPHHQGCPCQGWDPAPGV